MPASIIPDPGAPPAVAPITEWIDASQVTSYTIDDGTEIYSTTIDRILFGRDLEVTNNGTVWLDNSAITNIHAWFVPDNQPKITNNGLIYLHGYLQTELSPTGGYLVNTGSIFSVSDVGWARVIDSDVSGVYVENSGLIAAQGLGLDPNYAGNATAIDAFGWLQLINHEGGQILAEAPNLAIAVSAPGGDPGSGTIFVTNAGLIEANATGPDGLSIGVYVGQPGYLPVDIVNSGTIRADDAVYGTYQYSNYTGFGIPNPVEHVDNQATGLIDGDIFLDIGDDIVDNAGIINGNVDMGEGADTVDTTDGVVKGVTELGWGDDTYIGGANTDYVDGGRDNDVISGGGAADQLMGGSGDDTLTGGSGNDGLFGERGDDHIIAAGGDYVDGGLGDDRIDLGDYTFELVTGGDGFDTLILPAGTRVLNLGAALAEGRLSDFEQVELGGNKTLVIQSADVIAMTGGETSLRLVTTSSDHINLVGGWTHGADQSIDGVNWQTWSSGGNSILVQGSGIVTANSANSGTGLDAFAGGKFAPIPGAGGLDFSDYSYFTPNTFIFGTDFTVQSYETFYSNGSPAFYSVSSEWTFTNDGQIFSLDDAFPSAIGVQFRGRTEVINNGLIHVEELAPLGSVVYYPSLGVWMGAAPGVELDNSGEISVFSVPNSAIGVSGAYIFHNEGLISAISEHSRAIGVTTVYASDVLDGSQTFFNTGTIYAEAGGVGGQSYVQGDSIVPIIYAATGVAAFGTVRNDGTVIAALGTNAAPGLTTLGVYVQNFYGRTAPTGLVNNGSIQGSIAVKFENQPGDLNGVAHWVINNGQIFGDIHFENSDDQYDGSAGSMQGTVFGFGGNDTFLGGNSADSFEGGDGNDTLNGGGGADTASYSSASAAVTVNLGIASAQNTIGAGVDTLKAMENIVGSAFDDLLSGSADTNRLVGLDGGDRLDGKTGDDFLDGGSGDDYLYGREGNDTLTGGAGYDRMYGGTGDDTYYIGDFTDFAYENAGEGHDKIVSSIDLTLRAEVEDLQLTGAAFIGKGNVSDNVITGTDGANKLYGYEGNDTLNGQGGDDYLFGADGNDTLTGGAGYDRMYGGVGDDSYYVNDATDFAYENAGEGNDKVISSLVSYQLRANLEELDLAEGSAAIRGYGQAGNDTLVGNSADNFLYGRDGNDLIKGNAGADILYGENGNDTLIGGAGMDRFYGGAGADKFTFRDGDFAGTTSSTCDRIHDFDSTQGDKIHLSGVDANSLLGGDQNFAFIGTATFSHTAGELRTYQSVGNTYVAGDINGDGIADFIIRIDGAHALQASDFIL